MLCMACTFSIERDVVACAVYTINVDDNIRHLAAEVMHRVVRGLPHLRNTLLQGLASFISRLTDDYPEVHTAAHHAPLCGLRSHAYA